MIFEAIKFVANAHQGQFRKGTKIPYISHLMNVMKILCSEKCEPEIVVAGILHDVVEDTSVELDEVEEKFGSRVAVIVAGASEPGKIKNDEHPEENWMARKQHTIQYIKTVMDPGQLLVSCADKLDNARAILEDIVSNGDMVWERFNAGKSEQKWYYQSLAEVFLERGKEYGNPLLKLSTELEATVDQIFTK